MFLECLRVIFWFDTGKGSRQKLTFWKMTLLGTFFEKSFLLRKNQATQNSKQKKLIISLHSNWWISFRNGAAIKDIYICVWNKKIQYNFLLLRRDDSVVNILELDRANRGDVDVPLICRYHNSLDRYQPIPYICIWKKVQCHEASSLYLLAEK